MNRYFDVKAIATFPLRTTYIVIIASAISNFPLHLNLIELELIVEIMAFLSHGIFKSACYGSKENIPLLKNALEIEIYLHILRRRRTQKKPSIIFLSNCFYYFKKKYNHKLILLDEWAQSSSSS